jgi:hypothetical protein
MIRLFWQRPLACQRPGSLLWQIFLVAVVSAPVIEADYGRRVI